MKQKIPNNSAKVVTKIRRKALFTAKHKTEIGEALNRKTKTEHHTKQNNKTLNTLNATRTQH